MKYRGQLYSIVYGQATPPTIGQKTAALTASFAGEYMGPNGEIQVISWSSNDTLDSLKILTYVYNNDGTVTFAIYTPNN